MGPRAALTPTPRLSELRDRVRAAPDDDAAWVELCRLLVDAGYPLQAVAAATDRVNARPDSRAARLARAQLHLSLSNLTEAEADYRAVISAGGDNEPVALAGLAHALSRQGRHDESLMIATSVCARFPDFPDGFFVCAAAFEEGGDLDQAIAACAEGMRRWPDEAAWYFRLAALLFRAARPKETQNLLRAGLALSPGDAASRSTYLYQYLFTGGDLAEVYEEHLEWARLHAAGLPRVTDHANDRDPDRRLRVGLLAPSFCEHAGGHMGLALIDEYDRRELEITCYSDITHSDDLTSHYRRRAGRWRDVAALDDAALAALIVADEIDVLVDRTGHAALGRLGVFARKPAPVQVSWLEYMNTTGLDTIDYFLSDALATPATLQPWYSEQIWHLDRCLAAYTPAADSPAPTPLPALKNGFVTFAVFNNPQKLQPGCVRRMAAVLEAVPGSRLTFRYKSWDLPTIEGRTRAAFASHGVDPARLTFGGKVARRVYLSALAETDIALDTHPNNGFTTTLETLWMGVPVVTLHGESTVSRIGLSFLTNLGRPQWVASTDEQYVAAAVALASNLKALAAERDGLRARMQSSPLLDRAGHARAIERALRAMWRRYLATR